MSEFKFCPRCGAVTKPGICSNCGYNMNKELEENEVEQDVTSETSAQSVQNEETGFSNDSQEPKKKSKGWLVGLFVGLGLIAFTVIFICLLVVVAFVPLAFKTVFATVNYVNTAQTNPPVNQNPLVLPNTPDTDDEHDPENDDDPEDETDPDDPDDPDADPDDDYDDILNNYYYSDNIEGNYSGSSEFDYDKFTKDLVPEANEYWDENAENTFDYFMNGTYNSYLQSPESHEFAERDGFPTPYYDYIVDSYIENKNYDVERHIIRFEGEIDGMFINACSAYYALSSDKVDFTDVNEALRDQALAELYHFATNNNAKSGSYNYTLYSDAVITFNNDEVMSIVYNTTSYKENYFDKFFIHGMNIDVKNGKVMDNTKILNFDDDFSEFFVERSNTQNSLVDSINESQPSELTKIFNNDDALIIFFTPLGIEVGMNYLYHGSYGWVTISLNDFDEYLSGTYNFKADWGKGYDIYKYEKEHGITPGVYDSDDDDYYYDL